MATTEARTPSPADTVTITPAAPKKPDFGVNGVREHGKPPRPVWRNAFAVTYMLPSTSDSSLEHKLKHVRVANQLERSTSDPTFIIVPDANDDVFGITQDLVKLKVRDQATRATQSEPGKLAEDVDMNEAINGSETSSLTVSDIASSSAGSSPSSPSSVLAGHLNPRASSFHPVSTSKPNSVQPVTYSDYEAALRRAQRVFAGKNVVFVGNLPCEFDNLVLTTVVLYRFSIFGQAAGIVRRSMYHKPYAIIQYFNDTGAWAATTYGSTISIAGRECRVSRSNANKRVDVGGSVASLSRLLEIGPCRPAGGSRVRFERYGDYLAARRAGLV